MFSGSAIPTYGSDTVIRLPLPEGGEDEAALASLQSKVGDVYESADHIEGEERYRFLEQELSTLNQ